MELASGTILVVCGQGFALVPTSVEVLVTFGSIPLDHQCSVHLRLLELPLSRLLLVNASSRETSVIGQVIHSYQFSIKGILSRLCC